MANSYAADFYLSDDFQNSAENRKVIMHAIASMFATVITVVGFVAMFFVPHIVLRPFVRSDDTCAPPRRFATADFFVLALYLQFALVAGTWFGTLSPTRSLQYIVTLLGCTAALFVWFGAVESVSRTGIRSELRRAIFLVALLPLTIVSMLAAGLAGPALFWLLNDPTNALWGEGWVAWVLPIAAPTLIFGLRRLGRWLVDRRLDEAIDIEATVTK
jgi:hypothetical protein